jgi:hypothetical protein
VGWGGYDNEKETPSFTKKGNIGRKTGRIDGLKEEWRERMIKFLFAEVRK